MGNNFLLIFFLVYIAFDATFAQSCTGFNCLEEYVNKPDDAFTWSDTGMKEMKVVFIRSINLILCRRKNR